MRKGVLLVLIHLLLLYGSQIWAQQTNYEDLFEKVFKEKPVREIYSLNVSVVLDNDESNAETIKLTTSTFSDVYKVQWEIFFRLLSKYVDQEAINRIATFVDEKGDIDLLFLKQFGYSVRLNQRTSTLYIETPSQYRKTMVIRLSSYGRLKKASVLKPSAFTSYLNMSISEYYNLESDSELSPFQMKMTHVAYYNGWTLKTDGNMVSGDPNPIEIDTSQLSFIDQEKREKYAAGFFNPVSVAFMPSRFLAGGGFSRIYSDFPDQAPVDETSIAVKLEHTSKVTVLRNGLVLSTYQLLAGPVEFTWFPLSYGNNDFEIDISDSETNESKVFKFNRVYDNSFLKYGLSEVSLASGFVYNNGSRSLSVNTHEANIAGFYRQSLTKDIELTGYTDLEKDRYMLGGESFQLLPIGKLKLGGAALLLPYQTGWAASVTYVPFVNFFSGVTLIYQDEVFGESQNDVNSGIINLSQSNSFVLDRSPINTNCFYSYETKTGKTSYGGGIGTFYQLAPFSRITFQNTYQMSGSSSLYMFSSGLNLRAADNAYINSYLSMATSGTYSFDVSVVISLEGNTQQFTPRTSYKNTGNNYGFDYQFTPYVDGFSTALHGDFEGNQTRVAGELFKEDRISQLKTRLNYGFSPDSRDDAQQIEVSTPRGRILFDSVGSKSQGSEAVHESSLIFETALVYGDGHFALSRPVEGSFVMVYPAEPIQESTIYLKGSSSLIDSWGPAVVNIPPYQDSVVEIGQNNVPKGFDLGRRKFEFNMTPDSGMAIQIGNNTNVTIYGNAVDKSTHKPLALRIFVLKSLDHPERPRKYILSGDDGDIAERGLDPGNYVIELKGKYTVPFVIPVGFKGMFNLGDIEFQLEESNNGQ